MIDRASEVVIPAQPGWFHVVPVYDSDTVIDVFLDPVLAWCYADGVIDPITVEGRIDDDLVLKRPDGVLTAPSARDFETLEQVREYLQEAHMRELQCRERRRQRQLTAALPSALAQRASHG